ncbi:MAG: hypothetical protein NTV49_05540 [Kiritimatiellaeota bacterium]|nr:hypothetical protein [Kiritimatiellota bacterium]
MKPQSRGTGCVHGARPDQWGASSGLQAGRPCPGSSDMTPIFMRSSIVTPLAGVILLALSVSLAWGRLPLDGAGWSIMTPSTDSRLCYVSTGSGDDATGVAYRPSDPLIGSDPQSPVGAIKPFRTFGAAYAKTVAGRPDWILMKRGEIFKGKIEAHYGRADTERFVVTSYGSSGERPLFRTGGWQMGLNLMSNSYINRYIAIVGLHLYCNKRDPSSPDFTGYVDNYTGIKLYAKVEDLLIEDCWLEWYQTNISAMNGGEVMKNLVIRRNILNNAYGSGAHSQGMYCDGASGVTLEENVFDHNGWILTGPDKVGGATMFNHNTYFNSVHDSTFKGNMFLRASSMGNKWCANATDADYNITIDDNLYVEGEIGIGGGNASLPYRYRNMTITNNVMEGIGRTRPTARSLGWYIDVADWDGGLVTNNLLIRREDTGGLGNVFAINVGGSGNTNRKVQIQNNTVYRLASNQPLITLAGGANFSEISFMNNTVDTDNYTPQIAAVRGSFAHYTFSNNRYFTARAASSWFSASGSKSFTQWAALAGESGSATGHGVFPDANRTVETYNESLGGKASFDDFIAQVRQQSKTRWRPEYTARAVNAYIRLGFGMGNKPPKFPSDPLARIIHERYAFIHNPPDGRPAGRPSGFDAVPGFVGRSRSPQGGLFVLHE